MVCTLPDRMHQQGERTVGYQSGLHAWFMGLAVLSVMGVAHAFDFGHARLLSGTGQALHAEIAVVQLSAREAAALQASIAPGVAWQQVGLTPPVDLFSLQADVVEGLTASTRIVRLRSTQPFTGAVADLLIDVQTVTGRQRYQVSVLAQRRALDLPASGAAATGGAASVIRPAVVHVLRGNTLFSLAQRHAVSGLSTYQMMAALFHTNPQAFIRGNMNLLRAGVVLQLPDRATLARLSDRQARQLFVQHARAFREWRGHATTMTENISNAGPMMPLPPPDSDMAIASTSSLSDSLKLRVEDADDIPIMAGGTHLLDTVQAHDQAAARNAVQESLGHIAQLEENLQELSQVLQELNQAEQTLRGEQRMAQSEQAKQTRPAVRTEQQVVPYTDSALPSSDTAQATVRPQATIRDNTTPFDVARASPALPDIPVNAVMAADPPSPISLSQAPQTRMDTRSDTPSSTLWMLVTAALGLFVLLVVWLWRRTHADTSSSGKITDAMIQEKLNTIDLDLSQIDPRQREP